MLSNPALDRLTDEALLHKLGDLVRQDCERCASLLRCIDAIDHRKLWAKYGHPSLFDFLVTRHHMSESTAGKRIGAARTARRFPVLFEMVGRGEIHLSGVHRLKAHLTPENHERVLAQAKHKTIRQIEELVARLAPQPDVPSTLRAPHAQHALASANVRDARHAGASANSRGASDASANTRGASTTSNTGAVGAPGPVRSARYVDIPTFAGNASLA